ncbi:heterotetrameric sarcosine oxidase gamma subunit [Paraburkholderia sp. UCT70]|uniref:hypothetical protein n=1 Tax=Paraburkholderia sp. UCT70 TaxID=2991068 RepID=UPI003D1C5456
MLPDHANTATYANLTPDASFGWDDLRIVPRLDLHKATIAFAGVPSADLVLPSGLVLPRGREVVDAQADHVLFINRHTALAVSTSPTLTDDLTAALCHRTDVLVTDATSSLVSLDLIGRYAGELLSRGSAVDLRHEVFGVGQCACTTLGAINVTLHRTLDGFRLHFAASMQTYAQEWIESVLSIRRS